MPFLPRTEDLIEGWKKFCRHPEHNLPGMIVLPAGLHTWQCPGCGHQTTFRINAVIC